MSARKNNSNNSKTAVKVTAIILAIVILAVAIFCAVWFTTCSKSDSNVNNSLDASTGDGQDGDSTGSGSSSGSSSNGSSNSGSSGNSTDSGSNGSTGNSSDSNSNGSTGGSSSSTGGSSSGSNGTGTLTREITNSDIDSLTGALKYVRSYTSSYYATSEVVLKDNLTEEVSTIGTKLAYDLDNASLMIVDEEQNADADYLDTLYIFKNNGVCTAYDCYVDNVNAENTANSAMSDEYYIFYDIFSVYTDDFVGTMFSVQTDDEFLATESEMTEADVELFMQRFLYFASEENGYIDEGESGDVVIGFDDDTNDEEEEEEANNIEENNSEEEVNNSGTAYDGTLYDGTGSIEVYDIDDGLMFVYDYSELITYGTYTIQYISSTAVYLEHGYVTERSTQERLVVVDGVAQTDGTINYVYDTTYTNDVIVTYSCDSTLFDVDFTSYDGYEDIIAQQAADPDDGAEESEETNGD